MIPTKNKWLLIMALLILSPAFITTANAQTGIVEAVKAATTKIIKAVDLEVQRWQNDVIDLQNIQKQAENLLSKLKLDDIATWTNNQKQLYQQYFDELWQVKTILTYYNRFTEIINLEKQLATEYANAYSVIKNDTHFTTDEQSRISKIYTTIIDQSLTSVDDIIAMMKSFTVQMSDADRLALINKTADELEKYLSDLRGFTQDNMLLSLQRSKSQNEIDFIKKLYNF